MRRRLPLDILLITLLLALWGCAGSAPVTPLHLAAPPRPLAPPSEIDASRAESTTLHIVPGASFLNGLRPSDGFEVGRWISASPDLRHWPEGEPAPTLAVGRIIERRDRWARVELLTLTDTTRTSTLTPRLLTGAPPSVTKRLTHVFAGDAHGMLRAPMGAVDLITGDELYGVLSSPEKTPDSPRRLAARLTSTVRLVPEEAHTSKVELVSGAPPRPGDLLVLLGAHPQPPLPVEVIIARLPPQHPQAGQEPALQNALRDAFNAQHIGGVAIRVSSDVVDDIDGAQEHIQQLTPDTLKVLLWSPLPDARTSVRWEITSQYARVITGHGDPIGAATSREVLPGDVAALLHQLRGEYAAAAILLERQLQLRLERDPMRAWESIAPRLIDAYIQLRRDDWALEVFLSLRVLSERLEGDPEAVLHAAQNLNDSMYINAATRALSSRRPETLTTATLERMTRSFARQRDESAAIRWLNALEARQGPTPSLAARFTLARLAVDVELSLGADRALETQLATATEAAKSLGALAELEIRQRREQVKMRANPGEPAQLTDFLQAAGDRGCPALIQTLLLSSALDERIPSRFREELLRHAAWSAHDASRPHDMVAILTLLRGVSADGATTPPERLEAIYLRAMATLDQRNAFGLHALREATRSRDAARSRQLFLLAEALFSSSGDAANVAVTAFGLARLELRGRNNADAKRWLERGRRFAERAGVEGLHRLREEIEAELKAAQSLP